MEKLEYEVIDVIPVITRYRDWKNSKYAEVIQKAIDGEKILLKNLEIPLSTTQIIQEIIRKNKLDITCMKRGDNVYLTKKV